MGQGLALVFGSFETLNRDMTGQLGVEPSSLEGFRTLVEPKLLKDSFETLNRDMTGQLGVEPRSLEGLRNCGKDWA